MFPGKIAKKSIDILIKKNLPVGIAYNYRVNQLNKRF